MSYVSIAGLTVSIEQLSLHGVHGVAAPPHIISLGHSRKSARETVEKLRDQRIICSARGERIRVSLAPYNDASDVMKSFFRRSQGFILHELQPLRRLTKAAQKSPSPIEDWPLQTLVDVAMRGGTISSRDF